MRVRNSDSGKGKSGGYRLIYQRTTEGSVLLITLYSKTEQTDIAPKEIRQIILDHDTQPQAAGVVLRVKSDGSQVYEPIARFDTAMNRIVAVPIDLGPAGDQVFLILFGTGLRFRSALSAVTATIGGVAADVLFAAEQGALVGVDQVNFRVPRTLAGRGEVDVVLGVDGSSANVVRVSFK